MKRRIAGLILGLFAALLACGFTPEEGRYVYDDIDRLTAEEEAECNAALADAGEWLHADILVVFTDEPLVAGTHLNSAKEVLKKWADAGIREAGERNTVLLYANFGTGHVGTLLVEDQTPEEKLLSIEDLNGLLSGEILGLFSARKYKEGVLAFAEKMKALKPKGFFQTAYGWLAIGAGAGVIALAVVCMLFRKQKPEVTKAEIKPYQLTVANRDRFLGSGKAEKTQT